MQLPFEWVEQPPAMDPAAARRYCARLARSHYENFHVVTFLLPAELHQDFYNVYAYCRWSDDLADETGDPARSEQLLTSWRRQLRDCYTGSGNGAHPVFTALRETIIRHDIPQVPFDDLITAFLQDQRVTRYPSFNDLLGYCRNSANPVGRLVLYLCGYRDEERQRLSDSTCTALQLANFWQDVVVDIDKNRIYIPLEDLARFGYTEEELLRREFTPQFRDLLRFEIDRTHQLFQQGRPLIGMVNRRLATDLDLFTRGGIEILRLIEAQDYNVLARRPALTGRTKLRLLAAAVFGRVLSPARKGRRA